MDHPQNPSELMSATVDIHVLIQERVYDYHGFIQQHGPLIDDHLESCEACSYRMRGWVELLPKLRARMTVIFSEPMKSRGRMEQMRQLKTGQCLSCGCTVMREAWTKERASAKFYEALAGVMETSEQIVRKLAPRTRFCDLPLTTTSLRRLRDVFWLPDGSSSSADIRNAEEGEVVRDLPETIDAFISKITLLYSSFTVSECSAHWLP